jgi:hypothetical protein
MEYIVVLVTSYFRYQRPEGALAGRSRSSCSSLREVERHTFSH